MNPEPLRPPEAKKLIHHILKRGNVTYSQPHALERMKERNLTNVDCVNILRAGVVQEAEEVKGSWRYQVYTPKMCAVVRFESESELEIVTAWRT